jgi:hypothetical protein
MEILRQLRYPRDDSLVSKHIVEEINLSEICVKHGLIYDTIPAFAWKD